MSGEEINPSARSVQISEETDTEYDCGDGFDPSEYKDFSANLNTTEASQESKLVGRRGRAIILLIHVYMLISSLNVS